MRKTLLTLLLTLLVQPGFAQEKVAPAFSLTDANGQEVTLPRNHAGVDIYFFWASWCPYCKALMPHLQSILIEYGDAVTVYALNIRDDEDPQEFMSRYAYDFILLPEADPVMALYDVKPTPAVFVVDGQGKIRLNLYDIVFNDSNEFKALSHGKKAGQRAPYWAAEIRLMIDQALGVPGN